MDCFALPWILIAGYFSGMVLLLSWFDKDNLVRYLLREKYYDVLSGLDYVEPIEANGSFVSDKKLRVTNGDAGNKRVLEADNFIIATGSSPSVPQFDGIDNVDYLTNVEALSLKEKPSSMIVMP